MKTGMQKCSFFDDATGTVVQLNSISEEGEIKIKEPLASKDADGGERFAGHHSRIEITGYDDTGYDQLKTWMDNETPLKFVSYGLEGHILWYRETKITVKKNIFIPPGKNNSFTVVMEQKGGDHSGFDGNQIWYGKNLLYGAVGWEDADGDNIADGWYSGSGAHTRLFSSNKQKFIGNADNQAAEMRLPRLIYPIALASINFSVLHTIMDVGATMRILFISYAENTLNSISQFKSPTTLRTSIEETTVSGTYYLYLVFADASLNDSDTLETTYPRVTTHIDNNGDDY